MSNRAITVIRTHLGLTWQLLYQYGLAVIAMLLGARLLETLLMRVAVELGMLYRLAGLTALVLVIMLELMVFVGIFIMLRGQPLRFRQKESLDASLAVPFPEEHRNASPLFASALLAVLIPFYGYYAGWGLLGNTLRDYSRAFIDEQWNRADFIEPDAVGAHALQVNGTLWLLIPVALVWLIRRTAKMRQAGNGHMAWSLVIVACEATWVILGLFVLSSWKGQIVSWLAHLPPPTAILNTITDWFSASLLAQAQAAAPSISEASQRPVDWPAPVSPGEWLGQLLRYALLPLIWFNLGAIVYGHNLNAMTDATRRIATPFTKRWSTLPKPVTDFIEHFWAGLVKRWHAIANGVLLAASAGLWLTVSILVFWRLADWLGRWAWIGIAGLIGPQDSRIWALAEVPLNILFGIPGQPQNGVIVMAIQFCVIAAGLSMALVARERQELDIKAGNTPIKASA